MSRNWRIYLDDILECCGKIERFTAGMTQADFVADELVYDAVIRNLEIIGEAAKQIPDEARNSISQIEWRRVAGLRDVLIHAYFNIEDDILWDVIRSKVPGLRQNIQDYLGKTPE